MHLIDAAAIDPESPLAAFDTVNAEMALYSPSLARKPQLIALNKLDLPGDRGAGPGLQGGPEETPEGPPHFSRDRQGRRPASVRRQPAPG
ncbi:MAG: hypothetical protein MZV70_56105 [Desulfobacterales bacterium]|nr:hypothetical protein [Desulfobacterales bacterium]